MKYASVVIRMPLDRPFSYRIPENIKDKIEVGKRVWVPFGPRRVVGYVVELTDKADVKNVRPIESVIDATPIISEELLRLSKWISEYYICSWGEAIDATIPGVLKKGKTDIRAKKLYEERRYEDTRDISPNPEQRKALDAINDSVDSSTHSVFLLHGVTASGKTEIYIQAIRHALTHGRSSIVLVPEISLTPQTVERFKSRFGDNVAVMHSGLLGSERFREYKKIKDGRAKIVVGARSAIFSPVGNLGLVIIDEEHETSYKQENVPRYHAREVGVKRAEISGATVILGTATPSLESYFNAKAGRYKLLELKKRINDIALPKVNIVDMRKEFDQKHYATIFSRSLKDRIGKVMAKGEQAILFLNRRGFSTSVYCRKCGIVVRCKSCDAVMVYHYSKKKLNCHYCNWSIDPPETCAKCKSTYVKYFGMGTERVESELYRYFPEGRVDRMDADTTKKRGSHDKVLGKFKNQSINILVGTQMIAKGLDFPQVTLVGVVSADTTLNLPDFRASERTFNLLTQVAGRAGRGDAGGEVIIQTYAPHHYAITTASKHDYLSFYEKEIVLRKELDLPPFYSMIRLLLRSRKEERVVAASKDLAGIIGARMKDIKILGPAPAVISRIKNQHRWNLMIKTKDAARSATRLKKILKDFKRPSGVIIAVDVDPLSV